MSWPKAACYTHFSDIQWQIITFNHLMTPQIFLWTFGWAPPSIQILTFTYNWVFSHCCIGTFTSVKDLCTPTTSERRYYFQTLCCSFALWPPGGASTLRSTSSLCVRGQGTGSHFNNGRGVSWLYPDLCCRLKSHESPKYRSLVSSSVFIILIPWIWNLSECFACDFPPGSIKF